MPWDGIAPIEIVLGREGLFAKRNQNLVPIGSFKALRNATLEDDTVRSGGGATTLGVTLGALTISAAIDFWPDGSTQRTIVMTSDGKLKKDDGTGNTWSDLATGLTVSGAVPFFTTGGAEEAGRNRKVFYCDRINAVRVLSGDGASAAAISRPPADWVGTNQPGWLAVHGPSLWGGGNAGAPKTVYKSHSLDHEDFLSFAYLFQLAGDFERSVAALSYMGGLLVFCYPRYTFFLDTRSPDQNAWQAYRVAEAGATGPGNVTAIEGDVLWVSPDGSWHMISATQATGSVAATNLAYRKLGAFMTDQINLGAAQMATAQLIYYSQKQLAMLACHGQGQTVKNRRIDFDVRRAHDPDVGERWIFWDRDTNEALFLRKVSGIQTPTLGDTAGLLMTLDRSARDKNGAGYTFQWQINDEDFSRLVPAWAGRKKNGRFIQFEYDPRATATHSIAIYRDGTQKQTIGLQLSGGPTTLPAVLPVVLSDSVLTVTARRQLYGQAVRWGVQGTSSGIDEHVSLTRMLLGLEEAG